MVYRVKVWINQYIPAANNALAGIVISQAVTISSATLQRTLLMRSEVPTPMTALGVPVLLGLWVGKRVRRRG